ncbi:trans-sulfuration enzyme family protein [Aquimarina sp. 2201CG14-23]|uniref:trans-sulfuration enzyme family protein n=1 Tax=Aquimarina mycalae TaxID=3040073 RepID=UPI0024782B39|nr:aminotransferase class I/II-fold pyridoxal phosphate-dependent enzyme [Aquimarina sp. 2201CG14-23]MDH7446429.1 aminotransferase class I/II-fold pyridoxal phosphate-dependent enzyme [Aquimarina sp. 2201CG14-23]
MKSETLALQYTKGTYEEIRSVDIPLHLSTTFLRNDDGSFTNDYRYSRLDNPNRRLLEKCFTALEKGKVAFAFSSGMAAIQAVIQSLNTGDHVVLPDDVFFNVKMLVKDIFKQWGLTYTYVDMTNSDKVVQSIRPNTTLIWIETPSNPQLKITDIKEIVQIAKSNDILVAVDNTWFTPILQNPIEIGADIVMHSTTKYFGGHSDVMGGCLVLKEKNELSNKIRQIQLLSGAVPSPFDCWLIMRGIKTLPLRIRTQSSTAKKLAEYLTEHPKIEKVYYPGLQNYPQYNIVKNQIKKGFGAMLSVLIKGNKNTTIKISNELKLFTTATSLGGVESLIEHRASVEGNHSTTPNNLLRVSIGLEHIDDLIRDWEKALKTIA